MPDLIINCVEVKDFFLPITGNIYSTVYDGSGKILQGRHLRSMGRQAIRGDSPVAARAEWMPARRPEALTSIYVPIIALLSKQLAFAPSQREDRAVAAKQMAD